MDKLGVLDQVFYKADQYKVVSMIMAGVSARNRHRDQGSIQSQLPVFTGRMRALFAPLNRNKMEEKYQSGELEQRAQQYWQDQRSFAVHQDDKREKFYCLAMHACFAEKKSHNTNITSTSPWTPFLTSIPRRSSTREATS